MRENTTETTDRLIEDLERAKNERDGDEADLIAGAVDHLLDQRARIEELQAELEETNEGMVALTLELEEAEERYRSLFENAVEGIYKTTPDGRRYIMANSSMAEILGYDSAAALQRSVTDLESDVFVDPERFETYRETVREQGSIENFEYQVRRADGEIRWVSDNANTLYQDDEIAGIRGGIVDITDKKEYEKRLETRNRELEALNRVVRHDINNDVQVVRGLAAHLESTVTEENHESVQRILTASEHIIDLTEDAREFIEAISGREEVELEAVPLEETISHEVERIQNAFTEASVEFVDEPPALAVTADGMLGSVFRNLLNNAVRHHDREDPQIEVCVETGADFVEVRIADDGPGIPDDRKEDVLGKGEQSVDSEGTGIGLYLVHELVGSYGGDIWVEDRSDGERGAVFVVELPIAA